MHTIDKLYSIFRSSTGIATDSRNIQEGNLFVALKGPNFDGNRFVDEVFSKGAVAVICDNPEHKKISSCLVVDDSLNTLQQLARYHRSQLDVRILALTGSNGKTTTKELTNNVLSTQMKVFATKGNLNNHIGVPLSILDITKAHEIAIIEMGANHLGEIEMLCKIAMPDYGLITNIGKAHLEGFGNISGVKKGKGELFAYLRDNKGMIFLNTDDSEVLDLASTGKLASSYGCTYGKICGQEIQNKEKLSIEWGNGDERNIISSNLEGAYNLSNILAAICVGEYFGISNENIKRGIEQYQPDNNRSQLIIRNRRTIILDAYNANPTSMKAALLSFKNRPNINEKWVILGDMMELGGAENTEHAAVVAMVKNLSINGAIFIGERFSRLATSNNKGQYYFRSGEDFLAANISIPQDCLLLVKGSRALKLETLIEAYFS